MSKFYVKIWPRAWSRRPTCPLKTVTDSSNRISRKPIDEICQFKHFWYFAKFHGRKFKSIFRLTRLKPPIQSRSQITKHFDSDSSLIIGRYMAKINFLISAFWPHFQGHHFWHFWRFWTSFLTFRHFALFDRNRTCSFVRSFETKWGFRIYREPFDLESPNFTGTYKTNLQ